MLSEIVTKSPVHDNSTSFESGRHISSTASKCHNSGHPEFLLLFSRKLSFIRRRSYLENSICEEILFELLLIRISWVLTNLYCNNKMFIA